MDSSKILSAGITLPLGQIAAHGPQPPLPPQSSPDWGCFPECARIHFLIFSHVVLFLPSWSLNSNTLETYLSSR